MNKLKLMLVSGVSLLLMVLCLPAVKAEISTGTYYLSSGDVEIPNTIYLQKSTTTTEPNGASLVKDENGFIIPITNFETKEIVTEIPVASTTAAYNSDFSVYYSSSTEPTTINVGKDINLNVDDVNLGIITGVKSYSGQTEIVVNGNENINVSNTNAFKLLGYYTRNDDTENASTLTVNGNTNINVKDSMFVSTDVANVPAQIAAFSIQGAGDNAYIKGDININGSNLNSADCNIAGIFATNSNVNLDGNINLDIKDSTVKGVYAFNIGNTSLTQKGDVNVNMSNSYLTGAYYLFTNANSKEVDFTGNVSSLVQKSSITGTPMLIYANNNSTNTYKGDMNIVYKDCNLLDKASMYGIYNWTGALTNVEGNINIFVDSTTHGNCFLYLISNKGELNYKGSMNYVATDLTMTNDKGITYRGMRCVTLSTTNFTGDLNLTLKNMKKDFKTNSFVMGVADEIDSKVDYTGNININLIESNLVHLYVYGYYFNNKANAGTTGTLNYTGDVNINILDSTHIGDSFVTAVYCYNPGKTVDFKGNININWINNYEFGGVVETTPYSIRGTYLFAKEATMVGDINLNFINSKAVRIQANMAHFDYFEGNVNTFVKDWLNNPGYGSDNFASMWMDRNIINIDESSSTFKGDANLTFIASKQFVEGERNYGNSFDQNIFGLATNSFLTHEGNVNVSLGGTAYNLNLSSRTIYGAIAGDREKIKPTYTKRDTDLRTLYFGAYDEEGKLVAFESSQDCQYTGSFSNFDRVVLREGSSLYISSTSQINILCHDGDFVSSDSVDLATKNGIKCYSGKMIMPESSSLMLYKNSSAELNKIESQGASMYVDKGSKLTINEELINKDKETLITINSSSAESVVIAKNTDETGGSLRIELTGDSTDAIQAGTSEEYIKGLGKNGIVKIDAGNGYSLVADNDIYGKVTADVSSKGEISNVLGGEDVVSDLTALRRTGITNFYTFRSQMNDLDKRMGDLRTMNMSTGVWARANVGKKEYNGSKTTTYMTQAGADCAISDFHLGITGSYAYDDVSAKEVSGSMDTKDYTVGLYGIWFSKENGQFVDASIKYHYMQTDYNLKAEDSAVNSTENANGASATVEYGWRLPVMVKSQSFFVEPQAELMYGRIGENKYYTNKGVKVTNEAMNTFVGRAGVSLGWVDSQKKASAYVKASILNDWQGKATTKVQKGGVSNKESQYLNGTWGEFVLGGTYNINGKFSVFGDIETTSEATVRTDYLVNVGIRYNF